MSYTPNPLLTPVLTPNVLTPVHASIPLRTYSFPHDLKSAVASAFPTATQHYRKVGVLLITWAQEDPEIAVLNDLYEETFKKLYGCKVKRFTIPYPEDPTDALREAITKFNYKYSKGHCLAIILYNGLGYRGISRTDSRTPVLQLHSSRWRAMVDWSEVSGAFNYFNRATKLVIFPCCGSQLAVQDTERPYELMGAKSSRVCSGTARYLYSRSLLSQLKDYAGKGEAVSAATLHAAAWRTVMKHTPDIPCFHAPAAKETSTVLLASLNATKVADPRREMALPPSTDNPVVLLQAVVRDGEMPDDWPGTREDVRINFEGVIKGTRGVFMLVTMPLEVFLALPSRTTYTFVDVVGESFRKGPVASLSTSTS